MAAERHREKGEREWGERVRGHKGCPAANVAPSFSIKRRKSVATDYGLPSVRLSAALRLCVVDIIAAIKP